MQVLEPVWAVFAILVIVLSPLWALALHHWSPSERAWRRWLDEHPWVK